jgi:hypothetical protein
MAWQEIALLAGLVLAALGLLIWISRELAQPLEWLIDADNEELPHEAALDESAPAGSPALEHLHRF